MKMAAPYTGEPCVNCGALLTVADQHSSQPNYCAKCRSEADKRLTSCVHCGQRIESGCLCAACQKDAVDCLKQLTSFRNRP